MWAEGGSLTEALIITIADTIVLFLKHGTGAANTTAINYNHDEQLQTKWAAHLVHVSSLMCLCLKSSSNSFRNICIWKFVSGLWLLHISRWTVKRRSVRQEAEEKSRVRKKATWDVRERDKGGREGEKDEQTHLASAAVESFSFSSFSW